MPARPRAAIAALQPTPPNLYTDHDVKWYGISLWPFWVNWLRYVPSQLPVHLLTGKAWEAKKTLT